MIEFNDVFIVGLLLIVLELTIIIHLICVMIFERKQEEWYIKHEQSQEKEP